MGLSLHGLRRKIAAAAVVKGAAWRTTRIPGGRRAVHRLAGRIDPGGEATDSYRGMLAQLLYDTTTYDDGTDPVYDPVAGIVAGTAQTPTSAARLARAAGLDPTAGKHIVAAAAYRKPYVADFDAAYTHYERAHRLNPDDLRAVEGILSVGARTHYDWPRIWRYVVQLKPRNGPLSSSQFWDTVGQLFAQAPRAEALAAATAAIEAQREAMPSLHQLMLEALSVRLQFLGQYPTAFELRCMMAENRVAELHGIPLESALWLKHLLGAYAYLGQEEKLAQTTAKPRVTALSPRVKTQVDKLRADVALFTGDPQPLVEHARQRRDELPLPGDERMEQLVTGRRVAVVGPAASEEQFGEEIDAHDVVIRTRHLGQPTPEQAARVGSRTDIAYYSGKDLLETYDDVAAAAESGELKLAVTRPFYIEGLSASPQWLRCARFEYGLYFRGAPQGIQRIVYDLLQFQPTQISLFHADFYAGTQVAAAGYRGGYGSFGPYAGTNDVVVMHDLAYEFRSMQKLMSTGHITARGTAAEVLELSEPDYLKRLQRGPLGNESLGNVQLGGEDL